MARAHAALAFKALADPTRRRIYERLARENELTVSALTAGAKISQPAVSQHLATLRRAGLVRERREGRLAHYSANAKGLTPLIDWLARYDAFWRSRFDKLEALLEEMDDE